MYGTGTLTPGTGTLTNYSNDQTPEIKQTQIETISIRELMRIQEMHMRDLKEVNDKLLDILRSRK